MTDDDRLLDPIRAARALPKGSLVIVRSRDAKRRSELGEALRTQTHGLILLAANDPELAGALHGLHLPEARARLIARTALLPVLALGGVNARNAALLSGFSGIAAIEALS